MPLYEYQCEKCSGVHEVVQKFSDPPGADCPDCQSPMKKQMSATSFSLKGTGWYVTDYKRAGGKSEGVAASAATAPAAKPAVATAAPAAPAPKPNSPK